MIVRLDMMNQSKRRSIPATPARGDCGGLVQSRSRRLAEIVALTG